MTEIWGGSGEKPAQCYELSLLATSAAVQLDVYSREGGTDFDCVDELVRRLNNSIKDTANGYSKESYFEYRGMTFQWLRGAFENYWPHKPLKDSDAFEDLRERITVVAGHLQDARTYQQNDVKVAKLRDFCLELSKAASVYEDEILYRRGPCYLAKVS